MLSGSLYEEFSVDVTFKVHKTYNTCIAMVRSKYLGRAFPFLFSFCDGDADYYKFFQIIADYITRLDTETGIESTYQGYREQFRITVDWSRSQYNGFRHIWKKHALMHYPDEYKEEQFFSAVRGCEFHLKKNFREHFPDKFKTHFGMENYDIDVMRESMQCA